MDREMFAENIAALVPAYRCIAWDQRGFGKTGAVADALPTGLRRGSPRSARSPRHCARGAGGHVAGWLHLVARGIARTRTRERTRTDGHRSGIDAPETIAAFDGLDAEWRANGAQNVKPNLGGLLGIAHAPGAWLRNGTGSAAKSCTIRSRRSPDATTSPAGSRRSRRRRW